MFSLLTTVGKLRLGSASGIVVEDMDGVFLRCLFSYKGSGRSCPERQCAGAFLPFSRERGLLNSGSPVDGFVVCDVILDFLCRPETTNVAIDDLNKGMGTFRAWNIVQKATEGECSKALPASMLHELKVVLTEGVSVSGRRVGGGAASGDAQIPDHQLYGTSWLVRSLVVVLELFLRAGCDLVIVVIYVGHANFLSRDVVECLQLLGKLCPRWKILEGNSSSVPVFR